MAILLKEVPKNPIIVEGFPGFGLVGTITTEYLIKTLKAKAIGSIDLEGIQPMAAVHNGTLINPIGLYYDKKTNLLIIHVMTSVTGLEWEIAREIIDLVKQTQAEKIISIEGVGATAVSEDQRAYYYTVDANFKKRFQTAKVAELKEGIILGVTATLLLKNIKNKIACIFTETHSSLPDSKAAAKAIEVIDKLLNLKIDYAPLLEQAAEFEEKIKSLMQQGQQATEAQKKKQFSYFG